MFSDQDQMPFLNATFNQTQDSGLSTETNRLSSVVLNYTEKTRKGPITFQMLFSSLSLQSVVHKLLLLPHDMFVHLLKSADQSSGFAPAQSISGQHSENASSKPRQHSCPAHHERQGGCEHPQHHR